MNTDDDHLAVWYNETTVDERDRQWFEWIGRVETLLGHSADGDNTMPPHEGGDGYSMDHFYDMFLAGLAPEQAAVRVVGAVFVTPYGWVYRLTRAGADPVDGYRESYAVLTRAGSQTTTGRLPARAVPVWSPDRNVAVTRP